ncbi:MAG: hypothetical protein CGW95_15880 [Phenylobacterium zucineum]|nr:MAG: hypothetical protein CGW95_15880 [Phenylobacterium zucineum]
MTRDPTAGLGLKPQHFADALADPAEGLWFEVHPENYMVAGGPRLAWLAAIRRDKPLSLHGVGMSLAADEPIDAGHLAALKRLVDHFEPFVVSEHLAWSKHRGVYHPDLLPFPRTKTALKSIAENIDRMQTGLGRQVLIENPSLYMDLEGHDFGEVEFLTSLVTMTGCGLLLDVNNVQVSGRNLGFDPAVYLDAVPAAAVGEIHLAGHTADPVLGEALLIDTHGGPIAPEVWSLYERLITRIGPRPTLIERDENIPAFAELMAERSLAHQILTSSPGMVEAVHA